MKVSIECTYCGHKWVETVYNQHSLVGMTCNHGNCRDKNLIVKDASAQVDYYKGCPPFPIVLEDKGWTI